MKLLAAVVALVVLSGISGRSSRRTLEEVWRDAIAAKGGGDRLHEIRNFVIEESTPMTRLQEYAGHHRGDVIVCEPPGRWWEFLDYRPGKMGFDAHVVNLEKGLEWYSSGQKARPALRPGDREVRYRMVQYQYVYFVETRFVRPVPRQLKDVDGFDVVVTNVGNERVDFYLDRHSHLPARVETVRTMAPPPGARWANVSQRSYRFTLEKYETVKGISVPTRVTLGSDPSSVKVDFNLDLDPRLFDTPPDDVTRSDEWKRYLRAGSPHRP